MALRLCLGRVIQHSRSCGNIATFNQLRTISSLSDKKGFLDKNPLTEVEVSTEEFKYVEKLLPSFTVPEPPRHDQYPTPSGWIPPSSKGAANYPYFVERTRFHNFPVYLNEEDGGTRKLTVINRVKGDHWKFEADLREFLSKRTDKKVYTQVDELTERVRVRGIYLDEVVDFLLEKGF